MSRQSPLLGPVVTWALIVLIGLTGCQPQQPFYFHEDGDLSHYLDVATEIDYPDVEEPTLGDVDGAIRPFSLDNSNPQQIWGLTLQDAIHYALANSKVMRSIGGRIEGLPDSLTRAPEQIATVYDPAITESNPRFGTEAALSAFDAQFTTSVFWEKNDTPRNPLVFPGSELVFPRIAKEDVGNFQAQLRKTAATGGTWLLTHNVAYSKQNTSRLFTSDWNVNLEAEFRQPLLRGAGVQYNRIAGPGAIPGFNNGVMIARINNDVALADFEAGVRNLVSDVEVAYWELYYAYRALDAVIAGRDSGLQTWRQIQVKLEVGEAASHEEAQARQQYFLFKTAMERALHGLYAAESKLRYVMGLAATDGRLIRPADEPPTGKVTFDWHESHAEALARSVNLRRQKWNVKRRELELIAAKNYLLPRLDAVGRYRWLGLGDQLANLNNRTGNPFDNAYESLTDGNFQEWHVGLDLTIPIGFRKELSGVRHAQLNLARERARLQEQELEVSHQLAYVTRELEAGWQLAETNFNRRIAAQDEVRTAEAKYEAGVADGTLDRVLDAQRRQAEAENDYYRALVDYVKAIAQVHFYKNSLLEYNGVHLTEGPWPGKAYFDAHRRARARDASFYLDYGFTRPKVASRGAYEQHARPSAVPLGEAIEPIGPGEEGVLEIIPRPAPVEEPAGAPAEPLAPKPSVFEPSLPEPGLPAFGAKTDPPPVAAGPAAGQTAASGGQRPYDLGQMKLSRLAARAADGRPSGTGGWSPAKKAAYLAPVKETKVDSPKRGEAKLPDSAWRRSNRSGTNRESVANSPTAGSDWSASGRQGLQR